MPFDRSDQVALGPSPARAARFKPPRLTPDAPASTAFARLMLACLLQLAVNARLLRRAASPEAVHQARVALRRLKTYAAVVAEDAQAHEIKAVIGRLAAPFADPRALDVLHQDLTRRERLAAPFEAAFSDARRRVYAPLQAALRAPGFARDLERFMEWAADLAAAQGGAPLAAAAPRVLAAHWKRLKRRGERLDWRDADGRHRLRLQVKRMRYLADALTQGRRSRRLLKALKRLQAALGALNDDSAAPTTARLALVGLAPDSAFALGLLIGERRRGLDKPIRRARRAFRQLVRARRPWTASRRALAKPSPLVD